MMNNWVLQIEKNNKTYCFNTLNDCLVELDTLKINVNNYIKKLPKENIDYLKNNYFFDKHSSGELIEETYLRYRDIFLNSTNSFSFVIHLNYSCNLACDYCYQNDILDKMTMTDLIEEELIKFINKKIEKNKPINIDIAFIGGEPLLYKDKILNIMKQTKNKESNINYSIITNGTLINSSFLKEIKSIDIDHLFITLDGPESIHDNLRKSNKNEGSFKTIIQNLKISQELNIPIVLNYNINYKNYDKVEELILFLQKEGIKYPLHFSDVFDCKHNKENNSYQGKIKSKWVEAHKIALSYGYTYKPFYRNTFYSCGIFKKNHYNISPNGEIFGCITGMENYDFKRGSILKENEIININSELDNECLKCPFLVRCGGGCRYQKKLNGYKNCLYDYLKNEELELLFLYIDKIKM